MSVESICNSIQDAINASTLIASAPHIASWPSAINDPDLPMVLTRPGAATWPHECLDDVWSRRTYISEIYVRPNAQGLYAEGIEETLDIIQAVGELLTGSGGGYTLSGAVFDSEPRDRGLVILTYGGIEYRGTVFELDVVEDV